MSQEGSTRDFTTYRLELAPQAWLLSRKSQSRIFQQRTIPSILETVFTGLDVKLELAKTYLPRDYCVQYRETDFAFASRLMEEEGIYFYFRHTDRGHLMIVADSPASHSSVQGANSITYRPDVPLERIDEDYVRLLSKAQRITPTRVTLRDHTFELPHDTLEAVGRVVDKVTVGKVSHKLLVRDSARLEVYDWPGTYAQRFDGIDPNGGDRGADLRKVHSDGNRTARIRAEQRAACAIAIEGVGECRQMTSGHKFQLETIATDPSGTALKPEGEYVLTAVQHDCTQPSPFERSSDNVFSYGNRFTCLPMGLPFRPQSVTPRPQIAGTQTAVVTGPAGEEIFVDKYGRVKVKFHWDREGKYDAESSCWVRVSQIHAGGGWGAISLPRIGEEVVVSFEEGDPDRPLIVGRVYNPREMPPFSLPGRKKVSGMKSNTTPGGGGDNEISMDDTKGAERMYLHAQFNQDEVVDHDQTSHVKNNRTKTVDVDEKVTIGNNRTEKVVVDEKIDIGSNRTETVGANETLTVGANRTETIALMQNEVVGLTATLSVGAAYAITVGGAMNVAVGLAAAEEVGLTKTIVVGTRFDLICGAASITMEASGKITIKGNPIIIDGGSLVDIDGGLIDLN